MKLSFHCAAGFPRRALLMALPWLLAACTTMAPKPPTPAAPPAQFKESGIWKRASAVPAPAVPESW